MKVILDVAIRPVRAISRDTDAAQTAIVADVGKATVAFSVDCLRKVNLPPQAVIDRELGGRSESVLSVEEPPFLTFGSVCSARQAGIRDIAGKRSHISKKESR